DPRATLLVDGRTQRDELRCLGREDADPGEAAIGGLEERRVRERSKEQALASWKCEGGADGVDVDAQPAHLVAHRVGESGSFPGERRRLEHRRGGERVNDAWARDEPGIER